ncbi:PrsW family glutamic-type intramembrane protease [Treponema pectinovorum]|uniref:PrsW family glutamic-type intramembrane protease n=1 Tax=Treponema pectinovorum TaxID=164 RepID=UPI003D89D68D
MNVYAVFAMTFIPLLAVFFLIVILVPGQKIRYALWACILGLLTVAPAAFVQHYVLTLPIFLANTVINLLITAIIFNGLLEESFKLFFMGFLPQKKLSLAAYFSCAILAGMTLGSFESAIYFVKKISDANALMGAKEIFSLLVSRMFTSVLVHTFCAGLSGLYLWMFKKKKSNIMPFVWAVLIHGIYNFFAGFKSGFYWFSIVAIFFAALECRIWYKNSILQESEVDTTKI